MLSQPSMDEILATLRQHRDEFRTQYAMRSLGVFGSYVRGEASVDSDLDLLVEYDEPPSLFQFVRFQRWLSDLLGIPVDLVMKSALRPAIGDVILAEVVSV
jgi:uncharacterized protein